MPLTVRSLNLAPRAVRVNPHVVGLPTAAIAEASSLLRSIMPREAVGDIQMRIGSIYRINTGVTVSLLFPVVRPRLAEYLAGLRVERTEAARDGELVLYVMNLSANPVRVAAGLGCQFELIAEDEITGDLDAAAQPPPPVAPKIQIVNVPTPERHARSRPQAELSDEEKQRRFMEDDVGEVQATVVPTVAGAPVLSELANKARIGTMKGDGTLVGGTADTPPPPVAPLP